MAKETLAGLASDLETDDVKRATRSVERAFNGFGQPIWERVTLGNEIASEQGFLYHASGDLLSEWSGTPSNLTTYTYYTGDKAGFGEEHSAWCRCRD